MTSSYMGPGKLRYYSVTQARSQHVEDCQTENIVLVRDTLSPPANEVCEGNVFTGLCLSTGGGRAWLMWGMCVQGVIRGKGGCVWQSRGVW